MANTQNLYKTPAGKILAAIRREKCLTIDFVASKAGIHRATLASLEISHPMFLRARPTMAIGLFQLELDGVRTRQFKDWLSALDIPKEQHEWFIFNALRADYRAYLQPFHFNEDTEKTLSTALSLGMGDKVNAISTLPSPIQATLSADMLKKIPTIPPVLLNLRIED